jgi:hypothetical protein
MDISDRPLTPTPGRLSEGIRNPADRRRLRRVNLAPNLGGEGRACPVLDTGVEGERNVHIISRKLYIRCPTCRAGRIENGAPSGLATYLPGSMNPFLYKIK